jgi:hypothetical protein
LAVTDAAVAAHYHRVRVQDQVVEGWTWIPLPFEPMRQSLRDFRANLVGAVGKIPQAHSQILSGIYTAPVLKADVENLLFYNLGGGYNHLTRNGIRFEYIEGSVPAPDDDAQSCDHHRYALCSSRSPFVGYEWAGVLAEFEGPLPSVRPTALDVWWAMKSKGDLAVYGQAPGRYALIVECCLGCRRRPFDSAASLLKPVFAGIITALHSWQKSHPVDPLVLERIAAFTRARPTEVGAKLVQAADAPLGERTGLIRPWRSSLQVNPRDDDCIAGQLLLSESDEDEVWMRGELIAIRPRYPSAPDA